MPTAYVCADAFYIVCLQVYVRVVRPGSGVSEELEGPVVVTKNPCLHPGDIRVMQVREPECICGV